MFKKSGLMIAVAALATLSACNKAPDAGQKPAATSIAAPAGVNWVETVSETAGNGMLMGNPAAPIKLLEYGALSCPHCAHFSKESREGLKAMIASGKVSYELRTFLIHPQLDLPASILAKCNGPAPFFGVVENMFDRQQEWMSQDKFALLTPAVQQGWASMSPNQIAGDVATRLGLITFVSQFGVGEAKAKACLADPAAFAKLEKMMKDADNQYKIQSTPTFIINGQKAEGASDWTSLQTELKKAGA